MHEKLERPVVDQVLRQVDEQVATFERETFRSAGVVFEEIAQMPVCHGTGRVLEATPRLCFVDTDAHDPSFFFARCFIARFCMRRSATSWKDRTSAIDGQSAATSSHPFG